MHRKHHQVNPVMKQLTVAFLKSLSIEIRPLERLNKSAKMNAKMPYHNQATKRKNEIICTCILLFFF